MLLRRIEWHSKIQVQAHHLLMPSQVHRTSHMSDVHASVTSGSPCPMPATSTKCERRLGFAESRLRLDLGQAWVRSSCCSLMSTFESLPLSSAEQYDRRLQSVMAQVHHDFSKPKQLALVHRTMRIVQTRQENSTSLAIIPLLR